MDGQERARTVFDEVRAAAAWVMRQSHAVHVDHSRIAAYARSLPVDQVLAPVLDPAAHYLGHGAETAAFFVTLDAVNFGSGWFPHLRKRPGLSGYFTVATSLAEHFRANGPIPPGRLRTMTAADCASLFGQSLEQEPIAELMGLFARALNDLGALLVDRYEASFERLIGAAANRAEALVLILAAMPLYQDVQPYAGRQVPFYKRAQLTCADLALAFCGRGLGAFDDVAALTAFADNLVPHVLRVDGVLRYDAGLARRIDAGEPIAQGSDEEVEIRAGAVHVVELVGDALRARGHAVTSQQLDYLLWNRGQQPAYKAIPRHRARSAFY